MWTPKAWSHLRVLEKREERKKKGLSTIPKYRPLSLNRPIIYSPFIYTHNIYRIETQNTCSKIQDGWDYCTQLQTFNKNLGLKLFCLFFIIFCRNAGQPCGAEHFCAPSAGCKYRPLAQTEEAWSQETLSTIQSQTPVITVIFSVSNIEKVVVRDHKSH